MEKRSWSPGELLRVSGGYWQTCALHAGVKLDLFSLIGSNNQTAEQVAAQVHANVRSTAMLLDALCAMRLLVKDKDHTYRNTPETLNFLCRESSDYIGYIIMHHHHLMASWSRLDQAVKNGTPIREHSTHADSDKQESFLMGMFNMAMMTAPAIVEHLDLGPHRRLLDLGGGPGSFAIHFCLQNLNLKATVFDLPGSERFARRMISKFGLADRIEFISGDFNKDTLPGKFDVVWLSHILHGEGRQACVNILAKAAAALEPGGKIIIHEFILDDRRDRPLFPALFSLNMLLGTVQGQSYSESELTGMLESVGVTDIRRSEFVGPSESGILIGTVP